VGKEIEITPAMAEAGAAVLLDQYDEALSLTAPAVAIRVFEAMLSAQGSAAAELPSQS
jgi:hypothetical protein